MSLKGIDKFSSEPQEELSVLEERLLREELISARTTFAGRALLVIALVWLLYLLLPSILYVIS